jgi:hypothetical protein
MDTFAESLADSILDRRVLYAAGFTQSRNEVNIYPVPA